jgi:hypothetical protein
MPTELEKSSARLSADTASLQKPPERGTRAQAEAEVVALTKRHSVSICQKPGRW